MHWFQGTIPEAIAEAKRKRAVFMVYVSGDDERSQRMNTTYDSEEVIAKLESFGCVAVNLEGNSEVCQQFSQIYPVVLIPSTYFIGYNGMLLEIIGGDLSNDEFLTKIETILQPSSVAAEQTRASNRTDVKSNENPKGSLSPSDTDENNPTNELATTIASSLGSEDIVNVDERVERAKQLLLQQKQQKAKLLLEEEKQKEMERRKLGQDMQKLKHRQKDAETKQLADDLARDRAEEKAARDRVKEQIAKDRAERAVKYQAEKQEAVRLKIEVQQAALKVQQEKAAIDAAEKSDHARLQFRFPDGSSLTHQFSADDTLDIVRCHVRESARMTCSFTLSTTFPRREFTEDDFNLTLRELRLAPCAAILVLPITAIASSNLSFIWTLLGPLIAFFNYLRVLIFGGPSSAQDTATQPKSTNVKKRISDDTSSSSSKEAKTDGSQQNVHNRRAPTSSFSRREGNIHRISNQKDDDDENNTWNGNSTEQM